MASSEFDSAALAELQLRVGVLSSDAHRINEKIDALQYIYNNACWGFRTAEMLQARGTRELVRIATTQWPKNGRVDSSASAFDQVQELDADHCYSMRQLAISCLSEMSNYKEFLQAMQAEGFFQHLPTLINDTAPQYQHTMSLAHFRQLQRSRAGIVQHIAQRLVALAANACQLRAVAQQLFKQAAPAMLASCSTAVKEMTAAELNQAATSPLQQGDQAAAIDEVYDEELDAWPDEFDEMLAREQLWPPVRYHSQFTRFLYNALVAGHPPDADVVALVEQGLAACLRHRDAQCDGSVYDRGQIHANTCQVLEMVNAVMVRQASRRRSSSSSSSSSRGQAAAAGSTHATQLRLAGNASFNAGDYPAALQQYARALAVDNSCAALFSNRSLCLLRLGRAAQAQAEARDALLLEPRSCKGWARLGDALAAQGGGKLQGAQLCLRQSLKLAPGNADVQQRLEQVLRRLGSQRLANFPDLRKGFPQQRHQQQNLPPEIQSQLQQLLVAGKDVEAAVLLQHTQAATKASAPTMHDMLLQLLQLAEAQAVVAEAPLTRNAWSISWSDTPFRHKDSGLVRHVVSVNDDSDDNIRSSVLVLGEPQSIHLTQALRLAIAFPVTGSPAKPVDIFIAHRISPAMPAFGAELARLGIAALLESKQEAVLSSRQHGTDPGGHNNRGRYRDESYG